MRVTYEIEQLSDESIIIFTLLPRFKFNRHSEEAFDKISEALDSSGEKCFLVTDYSKAELDFSEMAIGLSKATKGEMGTATDPRIRLNLLVGTDELIELAAKSLMQTQYGKVKALVFQSKDEALGYARAVLKPGS